MDNREPGTPGSGGLDTAELKQLAQQLGSSDTLSSNPRNPSAYVSWCTLIGVVRAAGSAGKGVLELEALAQAAGTQGVNFEGFHSWWCAQGVDVKPYVTTRFDLDVGEYMAVVCGRQTANTLDHIELVTNTGRRSGPIGNQGKRGKLFSFPAPVGLEIVGLEFGGHPVRRGLFGCDHFPPPRRAMLDTPAEREGGCSGRPARRSRSC
jgi:hypothetical protein